MFVIFTVFAGVIAVVNVFTWLQVCKIEMRLRLAIFFYFSVGKRKSVKQCLWPSGQSSASNRPTWRVSFVRACHKLSPAASTFIPPLINVSGACPCVPTVDRLNSCFVWGNWNVTGGSTSSFFCAFFLVLLSRGDRSLFSFLFFSQSSVSRHYWVHLLSVFHVSCLLPPNEFLAVNKLWFVDFLGNTICPPIFPSQFVVNFNLSCNSNPKLFLY